MNVFIGIPSWLDLYKKNLKAHTGKLPHKYIAKKSRDGKTYFVPHPDESKYLDYLSWSKCLYLLHSYGAKTVSYKNAKGAGVVIMQDNKPFVAVSIKINGYKLPTFVYPLIKGTKVLKEWNQLDVHSVEQRAFVKSVAVHTGLGLSLWHKVKEINSPDEGAEVEKVSNDGILKLNKEFLDLLGLVRKKKNITYEDMYKQLGTDKKEIAAMLKKQDEAEIISWISSAKMEFEL